LGLMLLLLGMMGLYSVMGDSATKFSMSPVAIKSGCIIWMAVGVFLLVKGFRGKDN
jgi:uncharacterized membrane protein